MRRMDAIVQNTYGSADTLEFRSIAPPTIADDEVLVQVKAAGVDRGVWHLMTGTPYAARLAFGVRAPKNPVPGMDLAGRVAAVGNDVTGIAVGDEVFGIGKGTFAEYARATPEKLVAKPRNISFEQAAVVAISGVTALAAVRDHGCVKAGDRVLVIGASGGVGSFAVQLAKYYGAIVTGVGRSDNEPFVRSLGAEHYIDYVRDDIGNERYDVVSDIAGNRPLSRLRRALTPAGTLVIVGGENGGPLTGSLHRQFGAKLMSPFIKQRLTFFVSRERRADMAFLAERIAAGDIVPALDRAYPLKDAADALRALEAGAVRGKLALSV
jgi:NADPH:quinone reductase-like Zn-dependent oxidoreductase